MGHIVLALRSAALACTKVATNSWSECERRLVSRYGVTLLFNNILRFYFVALFKLNLFVRRI